jgi:predicted nucleic acid-binding protein
VRRVFWDTMVHAYWLEDHKKLSQQVQLIHSRMESRGDVLCSSLLVLAELLVGPLRTGDAAAADLIEQYFRSPAVTLLSFTPRAARLFAELRARQGLKPVDALHLSLAAAAGVDIFLTNDHRLQKIIVPGISFIAAIDAPLF